MYTGAQEIGDQNARINKKQTGQEKQCLVLFDFVIAIDLVHLCLCCADGAGNWA